MVPRAHVDFKVLKRCNEISLENKRVSRSNIYHITKAKIDLAYRASNKDGSHCLHGP